MVEVSKTDYTVVRNIFEVLWFILLTLVLIVQSLIKACIPNKFRPLKKLEGEIVLITGGAGGIGRLVAVRLAKLKAVVVLWDVNSQGIEESLSMVKAVGGRAYGYVCDLTNREEIYQVAAKVTEDVGQVTILINNAGVASGRLLLDTPDQLIQRTFDVNILSHFWTTKAFLPKMIENNNGHIVTVASMAGHIGIHKLVDYCSTKFAAVGFDESLRLELEKLGINGVKTTLICPYFIQSTGMFNDVQSRFIPTLSNEVVAEKIVQGIQREMAYVLIPSYLRIVALKLLMPWTAISILLRNLVPNPAPQHAEQLPTVMYNTNNKNSKNDNILHKTDSGTLTHRLVPVNEKTL